ncbi:MAG TPA: cytochrome bc complex cytochrome b subunit [Thermoanaerobaculia bacterium]
MSSDVGRPGGLARWLDQRVGWRGLMHEALDEPIPGGSRWAYVFGSGLLFVFVNQIVTGICLALYYVPSVDHAHTTVAYIQKEVWGGRFLRGLHSYGSSLMIVLLLLHLAQTFLYGAYKNRRELLWLVGCFLFLLVFGMSFTGYLLPWDRRAYFATAVGTNIVSEIPLVGNFVKTVLRGGPEMGTLTLSRFYVLHVFAIPALIIGAVAMHVFLFRRAGAAGPPVREEKGSELATEVFYPGQVFKDFVFGILLIIALGALALLWPVRLGPVANPADSTYVPRPEWYYLPAFQWLKYWHKGGLIIGIVVIPLLLFGALFGLPFLDRSPRRRPSERPVSVAGFFLVFAAVVFLGFQSGLEDRRDSAVRSKLQAQEKSEEEYSKAPFQPQEEGPMAGPVSASIAPALSPEQSKGALLFESEGCSACHGAGGRGGNGLVKLSGLGKRFTDSQLTGLLRKPLPKMVEGGMQPSELKAPDLAALVAYLRATMN